MNDKLRIAPQPIAPYQPGVEKSEKGREKSAKDFGKALEGAIQKQGELKFSAHALERLRHRKLPLEESDIGKIGEAVQKARSKGVKSSLLLYGDLALIASIRNSTIVTAMDKKGMQEHVFTGIDGAVIIEK